jgi:hypothetical protein
MRHSAKSSLPSSSIAVCPVSRGFPDRPSRFCGGTGASYCLPSVEAQHLDTRGSWNMLRLCSISQQALHSRPGPQMVVDFWDPLANFLWCQDIEELGLRQSIYIFENKGKSNCALSFGRLNWIIATELLHPLVLGKLIVDIVFYVIECQIVESEFWQQAKRFSNTGHGRLERHNFKFPGSSLS